MRLHEPDGHECRSAASSGPSPEARRLPDRRGHGPRRSRADVLDLAGDAMRLVADYSTGMRKKAVLGCALIHNPPVLFLDEPLEGVDPVSGDVIRQLLTRFAGSGSTVLFSSHVMELVESSGGPAAEPGAKRLCPAVTSSAQEHGARSWPPHNGPVHPDSVGELLRKSALAGRRGSCRPAAGSCRSGLETRIGNSAPPGR